MNSSALKGRWRPAAVPAPSGGPAWRAWQKAPRSHRGPRSTRWRRWRTVPTTPTPVWSLPRWNTMTRQQDMPY